MKAVLMFILILTSYSILSNKYLKQIGSHNIYAIVSVIVAAMRG